MSRRAPLPYDDHDSAPRGSTRPDPSYTNERPGAGAPSYGGGPGGGGRSARPRAGDFMADGPSYGSNGGRYERGGGRDDWRERGARDRSRSRSPRRAPPPPPPNHARSPPPHRDGRDREYDRSAPRPRDDYPPSRGGYDDRSYGRDRGGDDPYRRNGGDRRDPYERRDERRHERDPRDRRGGERDEPRDPYDSSMRERDPAAARSERAESKEGSAAPQEAEDVDGDTMAAMMGFGGFGTTAGSKVQDNLTAVSIRKERKSRQYMNRRGGFNRPLDRMS